MTEEQKQALINRCKNRIAFYKAAGNTGTFDADTLQLTEIALATLTEQPVDWKQRAEAAEAKLAELEKQEPVAYSWRSFKKSQLTRTIPESWKQPRDIQPLFTRPAPAADLADLVPDARQLEPGHSPYVDEFHAAGWNACRAAILRNIEEAK